MEFSLFPRDLFAEVERLQRQMQQALELSPSIRGFAPGPDPKKIEHAKPRRIEISPG